jgi:hypothetical protein
LAPVFLRVPDYFGFAGFPQIEVPTIPLEQHIAEKLHAYSRTYSGGRSNSRVKDLADILLVSKFERLEAGKLREALHLIFAQRGMHALPLVVQKPPQDWAVPYRRLAGELGLPEDLNSAHACAGRFLDPVLAGRQVGEWDPERQIWVDVP